MAEQAKVDVLAVLGSLNLADPTQRPELTEARAAVAELVALSRSLSGELRALEGKNSIPKMTGPVLKMLRRDLDAALARIGGAP